MKSQDEASIAGTNASAKTTSEDMVEVEIESAQSDQAGTRIAFLGLLIMILVGTIVWFRRRAK